ncbi:CaiB/BaiF CoA-transferase family protein [Pararhodobacter sp. CCB-MM2]|uniref:CaiB/BaiF CoA transferase family protein n=1 Tax=Pararhodobacter sp. CCB-MM2 TaxID=1786003 RepID=UPI0009F34E10|nr:CaiB/BaiF CoA-transferase family protein [Pararhodobacter sp. CCB-MM2]
MDRPLNGVKVVEFEGLGPAPFAAMCLADMGASVIRIGRRAPEAPDLWLDRDREVRVLDLKSAAGRDAALALIADADVLIEGFRPGKMEALGLGPAEAFAVQPGLIYGRMTGWGQEGPMAGLAGHDLNFLAMTGLLSLMGYEDRPPTPPLNLIADFGGGGLYLAFGIVCALQQARVNGKGTIIDAAMVHGTSHLATFVHGRRAQGRWVDRRESNALDGGAPFYRVYDCAEGGWMAVAAVEPQFWKAVVEVLALPEDFIAHQGDRSHWPAMIDRVAQCFKTRSRSEWEAAFDGIDACVSPVLSMEEASAHPQLRDYFEPAGVARRPRSAPRFVQP